MEYFECPRCQSENKFKTTHENVPVLKRVDTNTKQNVIHRKRICPECNKIFYTEEKIVSVDYFNKLTRKAIRKPIDVYIKEELWNKENE